MWQIKDSKLVSKFNVIVKNLPKDLTSKELSAAFADAGDIFSSKIPLNSKMNSEGFGFVCFFDEKSVNKAIELFHNKPFPDSDKILTVEH
jgi:RNA recognition motif-containing protein